VWLKLQRLTFFVRAPVVHHADAVAAVLYAAVATAPESLESNEYHWARFRPNALRWAT
jgi:hypothetical protein